MLLWILLLVAGGRAGRAESMTNTAGSFHVEARMEGAGVMVRLWPTGSRTTYQILSKASLSAPQWTVEREVTGADGRTEVLVPLRGRPMLFVAARPAAFQPAGDPPCPQKLDAMLVLDVSRSLSAEDFSRAKTAAGDFVERLDLTTDRVGLVSFAGTAVLEEPLTQDGATVQSALPGLAYRDGTLIHPAIELAQAELEPPRPDTLRVMLLLSDGVVGGANKAQDILNAGNAAAAARAAGIRIISLAYGTQSGGIDLMRDMASSAGDFHYAPDGQALSKVFRAVADSLCRVGPPANRPPWVTLATPVDGTFVPAPWTPIPVMASAGDPDGAIALLEAVTDGMMLGATNSTALALTWRPPGSGVFTLTARARDNTGAQVTSAPARVTVNGGPQVNAGPDLTVSIVGSGAAVAMLAGQVTDDGLPAGTALAMGWRMVGGPGVVSLEPDPAVPGDPARRRAVFNRPGIYTLRLEAGDSLLSAADDMRVTVLKLNEAPVVRAGPHQTVMDPEPVFLPGVVTDDGAPGAATLSMLWQGPAGVEFSTPTRTNTFARFPGPGVYELALRATDGPASLGGLSATGRVRVTVLAPGSPRVLPNTDSLSVGVGGLRAYWNHYDPTEPARIQERTNPQPGTATLQLDGLNGEVERAFLYWHGPVDPATPGIHRGITVNGRWLEGMPSSLAYANRWSFQQNSHAFAYSRAYRADVSALVRSFGPGPYALSNLAKCPEVEANGASLLVFFQDGSDDNNQDCVLVEGNDSNGTLGFLPIRPVNYEGTFRDRVPAAVHGLALSPNGVFIAGRFMSGNVTGRNGIARLRSDGRLEETFAPTRGASPMGDLLEGVVHRVSTVARQVDGRVLIGGNFAQVEGQARPHLARLLSDGKLDSTFNTAVDGPVHVVRIDGQGRILLGGQFQSVQGQPRRSLARLTAAGVLDLGFAPAVEGTVKALALQPDGRIVVGGSFAAVNGQSRLSLARLSTEGALDPIFHPQVGSGEVRAVLVRDNGQLAVGGRFDWLEGQVCSGLALLEPDGSLNSAFRPDLNGTMLDPRTQVTLGQPEVNALAEHQGRILAAGRFVMVNGQARGRIARLLEDGSPDPAFRLVPGPDTALELGGSFEPDQTAIHALAIQPDGRILIGGCFEGLNGALAARAVARLHADGSVDPSFAVTDEGWSLTIPHLNYNSGPVSLELHVSDGQPARVGGLTPNQDPIWSDYPDAPVHVNGVPWLIPTQVSSGNGRLDDFQIFAGVSVPGAFWPPAELAGLWDIVGTAQPLPESVLRPGLESLRLHTGQLGADPLLALDVEDAVSLVAVLARLPAGQTRTNAQPPVAWPADQPPVAWRDRFELPCGADRRVLDVLANDISPDGRLLTLIGLTQPTGGRCEIVHAGSGVQFVAEAGFKGLTAFTYTIQDSRGNTARGTATVQVTGARASLLLPGQPRSGILPMCDCTDLSLSVVLDGAPAVSSAPVGSAIPGLSAANAKPGLDCDKWLACTNSTRGDGQFACFYDFTAAAGDTVTLALHSSRFLSHLYLRDPLGELIASSAHSHDRPDHTLIHHVKIAGRYTVEVTSHARGETGPYTLTLDLTRSDTPRVELVVDGLTLAHGGTVDLGLISPGQEKTILVRNTGQVDIPHLDLTSLNSFGASDGSIYPTRLFNLRAGQSNSLIWNVGHLLPVGEIQGGLTLGPAPPFEAHFLAHANPPGPGPLESITIVDPAPGSAFAPLATIPIIVRVEPNGPFIFATVELIAQGAGRQRHLGTLSAPDPDDGNRYSFLWRGAPEGLHQLVAQTRIEGHLIRSAPVLIEVRPPSPNRPPLASNDVFTVAPGGRATVLRVLANDLDPDGDPLRITSATAGGGTAVIAPDGTAVLYTPPPSAHGMDFIAYEVTDGRGGRARAAATLHIMPGAVRLIAPIDLARHRTNTAVPLQAQAATPAGAISRVEFLADGRFIGHSPAPQTAALYAATWFPPRAGHYSITAVAVDATGTRLASTPVRILVYDGPQPPPPDSPPVAILSHPMENQLIREGHLQVRGTAADDDGPIAYELTLRRPADDSIAASFTGTDPIVRDGLLGTLDLTLVRNGAYVLELTVAQGFSEATTRVPILLDSQAKVGQLAFTEQDLVVPVGGLPIAIVRAYDSLNPNAGDLGPAWTFALRDLEVELDEVREWRPRDPDDPGDLLPLRVGGGRHVTLTLPNGRRTTFRFSLEPGPSDGGAPCFCYRAVWTPSPGVQATLAPLDSDRLQFIPWQSAIGPYWAASGPQTPMDNFEFRGFVLTNADGTRFELEAQELGEVDLSFDGDPTSQILAAAVRGPVRLTRLLQRNGERLEFGPDGIDHYQPGQNTRTASLLFQRAPSRPHRVIAVHAPDTLDAQGRPQPGALPAVRYDYHPDGEPAAGQLARVHRLVDRAQATPEHWEPAYETTHYLYANPNHPLLLTAVLQTNHLTGATRKLRHEFDENGRWTGSTDPAGRRIRLAHLPGSRRALVTDSLGHSVIHDYDPRGNLTRSTDPLGHSVTRAYDDQDNLISETDPLGHTTAYGHDARGHRTAVTNALGHVTRFTYDTFGNLLTTVDALGAGFTSRYDARGLLTNTLDALGHQSHFLHDDRGQLASQTDALGIVITNRYDEQGRLFHTATLNSRRETLNSASFTHDSLGRVLTESAHYMDTDGTPRAIVTAHAYDEQGRRVRTTHDVGGLNSLTTHRFDAFGRLESTTDPAGRISRHFYDTAGNRVQTVLFAPGDGPALSVSRTLYDELNRPLYTQDRQDVDEDFAPLAIATTANATRHIYDELGRQVRTERLHAVTLAPEWRDHALTLRFVDAGPILLDHAGNEFRGDPLLAANTTEYDEAGRIRATTDARSFSTRHFHDALGRRTNLLDALGHSLSHRYDANGNLVASTDALGHTTTSVFDPLNRLVTRINPDGRALRTTYDELGRRVGEVDARNVTNRFGYDALGRLVAVTNAWATPDATWATYSHDQLGRQTAQRDALDHVTRFSYDALGRRIRRTLPAGQSEHFTHDTAGNLVAHTQFNGRLVIHRYDHQNRLLSRHAAEDEPPLESFTYDPTGRRATMTDANGITSFDYDPAGRLAVRTTPQGQIQYRHDPAGLLVHLQTSTPGTPAVNYVHDALGRLTNVQHQVTWPPEPMAVASYAYDAVGNLDTVEYASGLAHRYQYDRVNRLTNLVLATLVAAQASFAYRLDPAGHRTNLVETLAGHSRHSAWRFDKLHRLTHETLTDPGQPPAAITYTYDPVGNRLARHSQVAALDAQSFTYDPNDRLTTDTYDDNGNTLTGPAAAPGVVPLQCLYDWANRLTNVVRGDTTIAITYNADGHRVKKVVTAPAPGGGQQITTTTWLRDDRNPTGYAQVLEETICTESPGAPPITQSRIYTYGLDLIRQATFGADPELPTAIAWFGYDGLGSTRLLLDDTGTLVATYAYDAFGTLIAQTPNPGPQTPNYYLYAGEQWDPDLALSYNRARYLNPDKGRFWTQDTFEGHQTDPLSLHKYLYAHVDPVNNTDPSGNSITAEFGISSTLSLRIRSHYETTQAPGYSIALSIASTLAGGVLISGHDADAAHTQYAIQEAEAALMTAGLTLADAISKAKDIWKKNPENSLSAKVVPVPRAVIPNVADNVTAAQNSRPATVILTRTNPTQARTNRRLALRGKGFPGLGKSWDEYPFASSIQGGIGARVTAVPTLENLVQGGIIAASYLVEKVNVGDHYAVVVIP